MLLSKIDLPVSDHGLLCYGNHCLGRTEDDKLCFFMLRKIDLFMWVYRVNNKIGQWFLPEIVDVNGWWIHMYWERLLIWGCQQRWKIKWGALCEFKWVRRKNWCFDLSHVRLGYFLPDQIQEVGEVVVQPWSVHPSAGYLRIWDEFAFSPATV